MSAVERHRAVSFERLECIVHQRRDFYYVGTTRAEMAAAMDWVRSLGHEAANLEDDGFRYRSVYAEPDEYTGRDRSAWKWIEPGEWLMHVIGERQDSELDDPHQHGPTDEGSYAGISDDWHEVAL